MFSDLDALCLSCAPFITLETVYFVGGLNFAYVEPSDTAAYRCEAYNRILRKTTRSGPQPLNVQGGKICDSPNLHDR